MPRCGHVKTKLEEGLMQDKSKELEAEAVKMVRQYRLFMPTGIRIFLNKLSGWLGWNELFEELKK